LFSPLSYGHFLIERVTLEEAAEGPLLACLKALEAFDKSFPGFTHDTHDTHGIESEGGVYRLLVLK
jgi:arginine decarboxylase